MNQEQEQYQQQLPTYRRHTKTNKSSYVPIEDGFVTSAGNPSLAAKYGNNLGTNNITVQDLINSTKK